MLIHPFFRLPDGPWKWWVAGGAATLTAVANVIDFDGDLGRVMINVATMALMALLFMWIGAMIYRAIRGRSR